MQARKTSREYGRRTSRPLKTSRYQIRSRGPRLGGRGSGMVRNRINSRTLVMLAVAIAVLFLLIFGIVGCVRSCINSNQDDSSVNALDSRVEYGTSEELTEVLSAALDDGEDLAWIAANAASYSDPRIVELAVNEPEAISFVRNVLSAEPTSSDFDDEVVQGTIPQLYNWDERWGYVSFGDEDLPLGVNGSGPVSMAMVYMGLTGQTDMTPADMAELAESGDYYTDEASGYCSADFFLNEAADLGLSCTQIEVSTTQLETVLNESYVVLACIDAETLTDTTHWVVILNTNDNGSITVYDPSSSLVTNREWASGTIVEASSAMYAFALAAE